MKQAISTPLLLINLIAIIACHKETPYTNAAATLTIVNTVIKGQPLKLSSHMQVVNSNAFTHVGLSPGLTDLYVFPVGDSLKPYYVSPKAVQVQEGQIYSLFLSGTPTAPDALLLNETIPRHADSTMGIRFINLSPGSATVNITLSKSIMIQEFSDLEYLQVTNFRSYSVTSDVKTYTFQVREAATNKLITSITLSGTNLATGLPRFKNVTLVLRGLVGGSPAAGITRVNHY